MSAAKPPARRSRIVALRPVPFLAALALTASLGCGHAPAAPTAPTTNEEAMALVTQADQHREQAQDIACTDVAGELEAAIANYEAALQFLIEQGHPQEWADATRGLGRAYLLQHTGARHEHLAEAIAHYTDALRVFREEEMPEVWAGAHHGLAECHLDLGDSARAIEHFTEALRVWRQDAHVDLWVKAKLGLAICHEQRRELGQAISELEAVEPLIRAQGEVNAADGIRVEIEKHRARLAAEAEAR
jgi:tetratricopeptide (TPR) repeat protein